MVRLDKLLDAWRADPRVDATIELGNMLLRANVKAKGALPRPFIVEFGDEAAERHPHHLEVLDVIARLFAASLEGARAQALYARAASLYPGDPRIGALETGLRETGLAVPPPEVAAKLAPPPPPRPPEPAPRKEEPKKEEPPPKRDLPAPRGPQSSLAEYAPAPAGARPFPIAPGGFPIDMEPSTTDTVHNAPTRDVPNPAGAAAKGAELEGPGHVPEMPTRELSVESIEAAIGDEGIPKRVRAPTVAGLGLPAPPLPAVPSVVHIAEAGNEGGPVTAMAPTQPGPPPGGASTRRSKTLLPQPGMAPPPVPTDRAPGAPRMPPPDPASPARMFTPVRAFTPPPGQLEWHQSAAAQIARVGDEITDGGETATGVMSPAARNAAVAAAFIDSPTTTQDTLTRPAHPSPALQARGAGPASPRHIEGAPPTQTRLVPQEDQLKAAAASIIGKGPTDASPLAPRVGAAQKAARRAPSGRDSRPDSDDGPPTGVTSTETEVTAPPTGGFDIATVQRIAAPPPRISPFEIDRSDRSEMEGQATARRDTSELLAAALLPPSPAAAPALGAPMPPAAAPVARPSAQPPPARGPSVPAGSGSAPSPPLPPPPRAGGLPVKPTLVSRTPSGPVVKPTLVSPGGRSPVRPSGAPPAAPLPPSSGGPAAPGLVDASEEPSTLVREPPPAAPRPPEPSAPLDTSTTFSQAITNLWDPKEKEPRRSSPPLDPRREPDDDGPATGVLERPLAPLPRSLPSVVIDEPSLVEELSADAIETLDEGWTPVKELDTADQPTGRVPARQAVRSTQKIAGTVAPAVVWGPPPLASDALDGGVRTAILTPEESQKAGRIDPLPSSSSGEWMITPPPAVAPRFGPPPPSRPPSDLGAGPGAAMPNGMAPGGMAPTPSSPPAAYVPASFPPGPPSHLPPSGSIPPPRSFAPSFGPPPSSTPMLEGTPAPPRAAPPPRRLGASPIVVGSLIGIALSVLVAGGVFLYDLLAQPKFVAPIAQVETEDIEGVLLGGRRADLDRAVALLASAPAVGRERQLAMLRARERTLRALSEGNADGLAPALDAARKVGWTEDELIFGELARAVVARDMRGARELQERWSTALKTDAFFLLASGVAHEQRGEAKAIDAYAAALGAEPRLRPAALRLARAELLEGDEDRGLARLEGLAGGAASPDVAALRALAWLRARRAGEADAKPPPFEAKPEDLPVELRFLPSAMRLATGAVPAANRKAAIEQGIALADAPAAIVLFGDLAFELHVEAIALEIGRDAVTRSPEHAPSLRLLARSALALAKLDVLDEVGRSLPTPQQKLLRGVVAYERGEVDAVVEIRAWLAERDEPGREGIVARAERLLGKKPMNSARIQALQRSEVIGGDLVAVDALLDAGDLLGAKKIVDGWGDASGHPLRALRAARLLRYQGRPEEAEAALDVASPTRPALVERFLLEADNPDQRTHARTMLDARFGEDRRFFEVYLLALDGKLPAATRLLETLDIPNDDAPLTLRIAAALALGATRDEARGRDLMRRLADTWPLNPDVQRAARDFGRGR